MTITLRNGRIVTIDDALAKEYEAIYEKPTETYVDYLLRICDINPDTASTDVINNTIELMLKDEIQTIHDLSQPELYHKILEMTQNHNK